MQDRYSNFDLEIRSLLKDAEEQVPSRVWDAVSAGLDKAQAPVRGTVFPLWQKIAAGIAAAAAIVLGVFLAGVSDNSNNHILSTGYDRTAEVASSAEDAVETISEQIARMDGLIAQNAGPVKPAAHDADKSVGKDEIVTAEDPAEYTVAAERTDKGDEKEAAKAPEKEKSGDYGNDAEMLRKLEAEAIAAEKKNGRLSFSLGGDIGSNNAGASTASTIHKSPSMSSAQNPGITELSADSNYGIPVSAGLGVKFAITDRWAIGTGIDYSLLTRTFRGKYQGVVSDIRNFQHYIGIPLNAYYNIINGEKVKFYAYAGGSAEKNIGNRYRIYEMPGGGIYDEKVGGLQWSVAGGVGIEYMIIPELGIFFDPGVRYYFDCNQPESIRTRQPFMLNMELGLRFEFGKR